MRITLLDACVLIDAFRGTSAARRVIADGILRDADRVFVGSQYLVLETLPKPLYNGHKQEAAALQTFFDQMVEEWVDCSPKLGAEALNLAKRHGLSAVDALHVATALELDAEFITFEKKSRTLGRVKEVKVTFL